MRSILLSPSVSLGNKIAYLFCFEEGWIAISDKDNQDIFTTNKEFNNSNLANFQVISEEELYQRIPMLRNKLIEEEGKFIAIDYKNGQVFINPKHKLRSVFSDTGARATNQANFTADTWTYILNKKSYYFKVVLISILFLLASYLVSWALLNLLFWYLFNTYFSTLATLDNYNMGTLNAGIVITERPTRIAVLSDVTMGVGKYPLVRVCKSKLPKKYNKLQERVPVSCGYQNVKEQKFWDYLMPNPLVFATNDELAIQQKINEIPLQDWIDLKNWIATNRKNFYEGYYPIRDGSNGWKEYAEPAFTSFDEEIIPEEYR